MVAAGEVRREDEREAARGASRWKCAHLGAALRAQVAAAGEGAVAGADGGRVLDDARREAHFEQRGRVAWRCRGRLADDGRRGGGEEEVAEVELVDGDAVDGLVAAVGAGADFLADFEAAAHADDGDAHVVFDAVGDCFEDVARVEREQGAEDDDDLARAVAGGVIEGCAGLLQCVL